MKILGIDDLADNLVTLGAQIRAFMANAVFLKARTGEEGLEIARIEQPDTILLDVQMPGMDGFETTRRLKSDKSTAHIPIILLTAQRSDSSIKVRGLEAGADAFLSKPVDEAELIAQVRAMVRIKQSEDILRRERDSLETQVNDRVRELHEKQRQTLMLLDAIPHIALLVHKNRRVVALNKAAADAGMKIGDFCWCGMRLLDAVPVADGESLGLDGSATQVSTCPHCLGDKAMSTGTARHMDVKSGGKHWSMWWTPIAKDLFLHYSMDMTEHMKAEESRQELQQQLFLSQKMESVGRLAGGLAHDLNNLLIPILGNAELLLLTSNPEDPTWESASQIHQAGSRARDLISQLLSFSRTKAVEQTTIEMNTVIRDFEKLLRSSLREDIEIAISLCSDSLPVKGNSGQLEQVLLNLAVNSQDAMPRGGRLSISLEQIRQSDHASMPDEISWPFEWPDAGVAMIKVADTGTGMKPEVLERIFEPFFSTKGDLGTGLGLATAYGLINQHGGCIHAASREGEGTVFTILLPVSAGDPEIQLSASVSQPSLEGTETILLTEDEEQVRRLSMTVLKKKGYNVLCACNGAEALQIIDEIDGAIDLLLTDLIMPKMNGAELAGRARLKYPNMKVLFMSGYTGELIGEDALSLVPDGFIQKPFSNFDLARIVRRILDDK